MDSASLPLILLAAAPALKIQLFRGGGVQNTPGKKECFASELGSCVIGRQH